MKPANPEVNLILKNSDVIDNQKIIDSLQPFLSFVGRGRGSNAKAYKFIKSVYPSIEIP